MNQLISSIDAVGRAIFGAARDKFHERTAAAHEAVMAKVREDMTTLEAQLQGDNSKVLSILALPCFTVVDGEVIEGTVRDHLGLVPQIQRTAATPSTITIGDLDPELAMRFNPELDRAEVVYVGEDTVHAVSTAQTMEQLLPIYELHLLRSILSNEETEIYWLREHAEAACAQSAATTDGATNEVTVLPDGSAFAVYSYPLPKGHWLYAPREYEQGAEEPKELAAPILTHAAREQVVSAIRYAVRAATDCGKETDFDPDALVQNAVYALCGPFNKNQPQPQADAWDEESEKLLRALYDRGYEDRAKERDYDPLGASEFDAAMCAGAARAKLADTRDAERLDFLTRNIGGAAFRKIGVEWAEHADARRAIDAAIAAAKEGIKQ